MSTSLKALLLNEADSFDVKTLRRRLPIWLKAVSHPNKYDRSPNGRSDRGFIKEVGESTTLPLLQQVYGDDQAEKIMALIQAYQPKISALVLRHAQLDTLQDEMDALDSQANLLLASINSR